MSENNNGLNEFNKRQIEIRQRRIHRRNAQRIAVLIVFLAIVAALTAVVWLSILNIRDNFKENNPTSETTASLNGGENTDIPEESTTDPSGTTETTDGNETTGGGNETTNPENPTVGFEVKEVPMSSAEVNRGNLILISASAEKGFFLYDGFESNLVNIRKLRDERGKVTIDGAAAVWPLYFQSNEDKFPSEVAVKLLDLAEASYRETKINDLSLSLNGAYRPYDAEVGITEFNSGLSVYFVEYPAPNVYAELSDTKYPNGQALSDWLNANAHKYGFVRRYTEDKKPITGHEGSIGQYRYVGYPHSHIMKQKNFCLEEYLEELKKYTFGENHLTITGEDGHTYEIYYVKHAGDNTNVPVPASLPYTVSGNNTDGFIVTVTLD